MLTNRKNGKKERRRDERNGLVKEISIQINLGVFRKSKHKSYHVVQSVSNQFCS